MLNVNYETKGEKDKVVVTERTLHSKETRTVYLDENKKPKKLNVFRYEDGELDYPNYTTSENTVVFDEAGNERYRIEKSADVTKLEHTYGFEDQNIDEAELRDLAIFTKGDVKIIANRALGSNCRSRIIIEYPDSGTRTFAEYVQRNPECKEILEIAEKELDLNVKLVDYEPGKYDFEHDIEDNDNRELSKNDNKGFKDMVSLVSQNLNLMLESDTRLIQKFDGDLNKLLDKVLTQSIEGDPKKFGEKYVRLEELNYKLEYSLNALEEYIQENTKAEKSKDSGEPIEIY